jgi:hypothetical protein
MGTQFDASGAEEERLEALREIVVAVNAQRLVIEDRRFTGP